MLKGLERVVWLDSGPKAPQRGRYDIISAVPSDIVNAERLENIIELLQAKLNSGKTSEESNAINLPFTSGWIGYISYEGRHNYFGLHTETQYRCPRVYFAWYDWALIQDHKTQRCYLYFASSCSPALVHEIQSLLKAPNANLNQRSKAYQCSSFKAELDQANYLAHVEKIKQYIFAGDCYQVNYTQRFSAEFKGSASDAYLQLRQTVPSPFSAYFALASDQTILSISPERFIKLTRDEALTQPIKGTAPINALSQMSAPTSKTLQASVKNRAENLMIVDLLRNDFSQLCTPFSVKAPNLFELKSFANVHHLVSTIAGKLKPGVMHPEFIQACFPGGSITGAPKKRAMEIIDELEPFERGIYCGSIGYFSTNAHSDFNIAIRSFYREQNKIYCWGGGGIVADSDPIEEYEESWHKIHALMAAISTQ